MTYEVCMTVVIGQFFIPGPLPGMNEIISAKGNRFGKGASAYDAMKKKWGAVAGLLAKRAKFPVTKEAHFVYLWREQSRRRDPSNFTSGGRKIIEDGLQECRLLAGDGWANVLSIQDYWLVDSGRPGVTVFVTCERASEPQSFWENQEKWLH